MKDSLKDFIDQNRDSFDNRQPKQESWERIRQHLPIKSSSYWNSVIVWRAAAILFLGVSMYLFFFQQGYRGKTESARLKGEFVDLESFYSNQIVEKKELVTQFQSETGLTEDEVTQNLQKLEAMYQILKEEMETRPTQDVKDALVLNLLIRIDLLNQQLNKLDRRVKDKDAPISS